MMQNADCDGAVGGGGGGGSSAESSVSSGDVDDSFDGKDSDKEGKKKKNRCAICRKKVGLTGACHICHYFFVAYHPSACFKWLRILFSLYSPPLVCFLYPSLRCLASSCNLMM
jgi:hypothetical protein